MKMKPQTKYMGVRIFRRPLHMVASQQKICVPLAIAIIMLDAVKYDSPICGRSVAKRSEATQSAEISVNVIICAQKSTRLPGENWGPESGGYANQPTSTPVFVKNA